MLNPDFQPCPPFQSAVIEELIKWVWLGLKKVIIVKMIVKIQKKTINSSKILYTSSPRVGLDGDVDGVDGKTPPAQEEVTKVGPKICNTLNL